MIGQILGNSYFKYNISEKSKFSLLTTNRKVYMTIRATLSQLTLIDLERSNSRSLIFSNLISEEDS